MAITIVNTTLQGFGAGINLPAGDEVLVTRSGQILEQNEFAVGVVLNGNNDVTILGVVGGGRSAVQTPFTSPQGNNTVTIGDTGYAFSMTGSTTILMAGDGPNQLTNHGTIAASRSSAIELYGDGSRLNNTGTISAQDSGAILGGDTVTVLNSGTIQAGFIGLFGNLGNSSIVNTGLIQGGTYGVYLNSPGGNRLDNSGTIAGRVGLWLDQLGNDNHILNTGTIAGTTHGIQLRQVLGTTITNLGTITGGIDLGDDGALLFNEGRIEGGLSFTSFFANPGATQIRNSGQLYGDEFNVASYGHSQAEQVWNSGFIRGAVNLRDGDDLYDGRAGRLLGGVNGGIGADTILGGVDGEWLVGEAGDDVIVGAAGDDTIEGGAGADDLDGGAGIDLLDYFGGAVGVNVNLTSNLGFGGDAEGDLIVGFEAVAGTVMNDTLTGAAGAEKLMGRGGNDLLTGLAGGDRLAGGEGNDTLEGGAGADVLSGGAGLDRDRFVYSAISESTAATSGRDRITDFQQTLDWIDISAIDAIPGGTDNAFAFIGTAAFTGAGQLRYTVQGGVRTLVEAETTGDNKADFAILLNGVYTLSALDFIL
jgi:Ca2+-binding RTX toxin-like protein